MKFTNVSGEIRDLPTLGLMGIQPDAEFDVADEDAAENLLTDPAFKPVDKPAAKSVKTPEEK